MASAQDIANRIPILLSLALAGLFAAVSAAAPGGLAGVDNEVSRPAATAGCAGAFDAMLILCLIALTTAPLLRKPRASRNLTELGVE